MTRRHCHLTDVQVAFTAIPHYEVNPFENFGDDTGRDDYARIVVEEDVLRCVLDPTCRAARLAHGVERPGHVGQDVGASDFPLSAFED